MHYYTYMCYIHCYSGKGNSYSGEIEVLSVSSTCTSALSNQYHIVGHQRPIEAAGLNSTPKTND